MATAAQTKAEPPLEFHKGVDYACLLLPGQTTDKPLAHIYGVDRDVTRYGNLFVAASELLEMAKLLERTIVYQISRSNRDGDDEGARLKYITLAQVRTAIAKAEGR